MPKTVTERVAVKLSIMDNFAVHKKELIELGAPEEDIAKLLKAAEAVVAAEEAEFAASSIDLIEITEPYTCVNGWTINPPTKQARFYARNAALAATGGQTPSTELGAILAVLAGLWALRMAGSGQVQAVLAALAVAGEIARIIAEIQEEALAKGSFDDLAGDYMRLMGFPLPLAPGAKAGAMALENYLHVRSEILSRLVKSFHGT